MRIRKLDANGDMVFGKNAQSFWINAVDGVAQLCVSRLNLIGGSWWYDTTAGMFWQPYVVGMRTAYTRDAAVKACILATQGVNGIAQYSSALNRDTRAFTLNAMISTTYSVGPLTAEINAAAGII